MKNNSAVNIRLEKFEGPLELLLELIEKEKLSINEVSLKEVAGQFLERVRTLEDFPVREVADFIVMASTLMLIKSRALLPSLELTTEEETDISELQERLALYVKFKEVSKKLEEIFGKNILLSKNPFRNYKVEFRAPEFRRKRISLFDISATMREILLNLPEKEELPETSVKTIISLEEKILNISERISRSIRSSFHEISGHRKNRILAEEEKTHIIVSFLAILELVKQGIVMVQQEIPFEDFSIQHE